MMKSGASKIHQSNIRKRAYAGQLPEEISGYMQINLETVMAFYPADVPVEPTQADIDQMVDDRVTAKLVELGIIPAPVVAEAVPDEPVVEAVAATPDPGATETASGKGLSPQQKAAITKAKNKAEAAKKAAEAQPPITQTEEERMESLFADKAPGSASDEASAA